MNADLFRVLTPAVIISILALLSILLSYCRIKCTTSAACILLVFASGDGEFWHNCYFSDGISSFQLENLHN